TIDSQPLQPVLSDVENRRHSGHVLRATPERNAEQVSFRVVAPLMIDASMRHCIAAGEPADFGAAMGAAVHPSRQAAVLGAGHDYGRVADIAALEIAGLGYLGLETEETPERSAKDALLLESVDRGRGEHGIW